MGKHSQIEKFKMRVLQLNHMTLGASYTAVMGFQIASYYVWWVWTALTFSILCLLRWLAYNRHSVTYLGLMWLGFQSNTKNMASPSQRLDQHSQAVLSYWESSFDFTYLTFCGQLPERDILPPGKQILKSRFIKQALALCSPNVPLLWVFLGSFMENECYHVKKIGSRQFLLTCKKTALYFLI